MIRRRFVAILLVGITAALSFPALAGAEPTEDTEPPQLQSLSLEPDEIDTSEAAQSVAFAAHLTDNLSGVSSMILRVESPGGQQSAIAVFSLASGSPTDGIYKATANFARFSELGTWQIVNVALFDSAGNVRQLHSSDLVTEGFPSTITVTPTAPSLVAISPGSGPEAGGTEVQISGSAFSGATEVCFGSVAATGFTIDSSTSITATAPPGTGTVDVTVTTPAGTSAATTADLFRYSPSVSLTANHNPSVRGQSVTFTAKVTPTAKGAPKPEGTVAFNDGSETLGTTSLNANGIARLTTKVLEVGDHEVIGEYGGDAYFGPSNSPVLAQVVHNAPTELLLKSSRNPAPYNSKTTLTATLKILPPRSGTPTGSITFLEDGSPIATIPLEGKKVAKLSLKGHAPGTSEFQAAYGGGDGYEASESVPLNQTITNAPTELLLKSSRSPAPAGAPVTLTATVKVLAPATGIPTGDVVLIEDGNPVATLPLPAGKKVIKYSLKGHPPSIFNFVATYGGDENYEASESMALIQMIVP